MTKKSYRYVFMYLSYRVTFSDLKVSRNVEVVICFSGSILVLLWDSGEDGQPCCALAYKAVTFVQSRQHVL